MTRNTERIYLAAQEAFQVWRRGSGLRFPVSHDDLALYLRQLGRLRGESVVPVHLSAIAKLYRDSGHPIDTKSEVIQRVVGRARERMRGA